jgi:hypothetical protein
MSAKDTQKLIGVARSFSHPDAAKYLGIHEVTAQLITDLADALESLTAPSGSDREVLVKMLYMPGEIYEEYAQFSADAIIAAGFHRSAPIDQKE